MRVCFYDDSTVFGGHEVMAVEAAGALGRDPGWSVGFVVSRANVRLADALRAEISAGARIEVIVVPVRTRTLNMVRALFAYPSILRVARLLRRWCPETVVIVQGRIEIGLIGLFAAKLLGFRTLSYVPAAHTLVEMGRRFFPRVRDILSRLYYRLPDLIVTISPTIATQIKRMAPGAVTAVVENLVAIDPDTRIGKEAARRLLNLPPAPKIAGIIGRVSLKPKGYDILVDAVSLDKGELAGWIFVVVGEGPDLPDLKRLVSTRGVSGKFIFLSWQERMEIVYSAVDLVVVPSRFEGVPLVMLEALAFGVPVVATNRDGMVDWLPRSVRFDLGPRSADDLRAAIKAATIENGARDWLTALSQRAQALRDVDRFAASWKEVLLARR